MNRAPVLAGLAALVLAVGFWFAVWSPMSDEQAALVTEAATLDAQAATLRTEVARLREIQADQPAYESRLARLEEYLPTGAAQPTALDQLQEAADLAGVEITQVVNGTPVLVEGAPPAEDPSLALASISVSMTMEGGFFQHVDLLRRLEVDVPRALLVHDVSVTESGDGFPALTTSWSGEMFAVVPITEAAPAGTDTTPGADGAAGSEDAGPSSEEQIDGESVQTTSDTEVTR